MNKRGWIIFSGILATMALIIVTGVTAATLSDPETSTNNVVRAPNWYDWAWGYRKPVTVTSSAALTNYQLKLTVDTATLVTAGKMQSDGDDIRFTTSDGATLCDYWLDSGINTASTIIWVEVPSIASGSTTIYMYYSNASATAVSNGTNTFIFFDDFESGVGAWTAVSAGAGRSFTQSSAQQTHSTYSMYIDDGSTTSTYGVYAGFTSQSGTFTVDYDIRPVQNTMQEEMQLRVTNNIGPRLRFSNTAGGSDIEYNNGGTWTNLPTATSYSANTWYSFTLDDIRTGGSPDDTYDIYIDGSQKANDVLWDANRNSLNRIYFISGTASETPKVYVDAVRVRQYTASVPSYVVGSEE
ncbi:MAG: DUF2341 domain-containing protein [Dehalococcoidia bacterium]|nr:DUF2341 domain-containing protein [Dehalococcoidia bacterium]